MAATSPTSRCAACGCTLAWVPFAGWRGLSSLGCTKRFGGHLAMDDPPSSKLRRS